MTAPVEEVLKLQSPLPDGVLSIVAGGAQGRPRGGFTGDREDGGSGAIIAAGLVAATKTWLPKPASETHEKVERSGSQEAGGYAAQSDRRRSRKADGAARQAPPAAKRWKRSETPIGGRTRARRGSGIVANIAAG